MTLLVAAAITGVAQLLVIAAAGGYRPLSLGSIWFHLHANSLVGFQALVEKTLGSAVWMPIQFLLTQPAVVVLAVPGVVLLLLCRRPRRPFG